MTGVQTCALPISEENSSEENDKVKSTQSRPTNSTRGWSTEINRIPPCTRYNIVMPFSKTLCKYQLGDHFLRQLNPNDSEDEEKKQFITDFLTELNCHQKVFPCNQTISLFVWIVSWIISFIVFTLGIWLLFIILIFSLFNLIMIVIFIWGVWYLFTRIPVFVSAYFVRRRMSALKKYLKKINKKLGEKVKVSASYDGTYIEVKFIEEDPADSVSSKLEEEEEEKE